MTYSFLLDWSTLLGTPADFGKNQSPLTQFFLKILSLLQQGRYACMNETVDKFFRNRTKYWSHFLASEYLN